MSNVYGIVLAAGQGTRMKSNKPKFLHAICGKTMLEHVVSHVGSTMVGKPIVVIGYGAEQVKQVLGGRVSYVMQEQQLGTGHAVMQARSLLQDKKGTTIVIAGDTPLIRPDTLERLIKHQTDSQAAATILTAQMEDPTGYGRIVRTEEGTVSHIVEHKDANDEERQITEVNTATFCFDNQLLFEALKEVTNDNKQQEYYLTDVIGILRKMGQPVEAYCTPDPLETIGINDRVALSEAQRIMQRRIIVEHMRNGVTFLVPDQTYVESGVVIGQDTVIYPGVQLKGNTVIGKECEIGANSEIQGCTIEDHVAISHSVLMDAYVESGATIGPFAYIRPNSRIGRDVKIGDFVEIKNSTIGSQSKASHLAYIGDAEIGEGVNIGCGVITVNYDGFHKHHTIVEDGAFVGSNVNLVAPVRIGKGAYVVAGSTITQDVPDGDLAIARQRQTNKPGYAEKIKAKLKKKK